MSYHLDFSKQAEKDIDFHKQSGNKQVLQKILVLLNELLDILLPEQENPKP